MNASASPPWLELFAAGPEVAKVAVAWRVIRRGGQPFLYLPTHNRAAARALELYPAQTRKARLAKTLLKLSYRCSLLSRGRGETFLLPAQNLFLASLALTAGLSAGQIPEFAVLAGNPNAPGRRYIFLLFDADAKPVAVVKAGNTDRARELIQHEAALLRELGGKQNALPKLRDETVCNPVVAFSTDFIAGTSPRGDATSMLEKILTAWLDQTREITLAELPVWQRLEQATKAAPLPEIVRSLGARRLRPTLMHGDLAPWNVKVTADGSWKVLDWERGELAGVPGWDWLHFVLQPAVLVQREPLPQTLIRLERLFSTAEFQRYAHSAGIAGIEWPLAAAYVSHCLRVNQQTEGAAQLQPLQQAVQERAATFKR